MLGGRLPTLAANGALLVSGVLSSACVSRALAPDGRGEYVTWQAWGAGVAILAIGGLPQALVLDRRRCPPPVAAAFTSTVAAALVVVVVLAGVLRPAPLLVLATVLVVVANQAGAIGPALAQRAGRMGAQFNLARLAPQAAALAAIALLLAAGDRVAAHWLVAVAGAQAAVAVAWAVLALRRAHSSSQATVTRCARQRRVRRARRGARDAIRLRSDTWALFPQNFATQVQYRFDLIAVAALFPHETVAFYAVGVAAQAAVLAMGQASGMYRFANRSGAQHRLRDELRHTLAFAALAALPLAGSSVLWVPAVYGPAFAPAELIVAVLCLAGVAQSVDYLLVHEVLRRRGAGAVLRGRIPGLITVLAGFVLVRWLALPVAVLGLAPLAGYTASSAAFLRALHRPEAAGRARDLVAGRA